ncbi:hypothetical protein BN1232_06021 [Mycobacterium lentiflavum]|uniref:Uncharacterized protein n=1 Tax=Mycobacterium lentiflavum TaxID=141349 RepID=A0A0E4CRC4_MYCLN|nr:hypothetical protein BN1232_06021 [Mycobacterium lentiflavum]
MVAPVLRRVLLGDNPIRAVMGQAEFDQPPQIKVLAVFGQPGRVTSGLPGGTLPRIVRADPEAFTGAAAGALGPQRTAGAAPKRQIRPSDRTP